MSQKNIKLTGEANWAKLQQPDEYLGVQRWTIALTLDEESLKVFKASGSRLNLKEGKTINIKKTVEPPRNWKTPWGQPSIYYKGTRDDSLVIGNGSTVSCEIQVYETSYGKGTRLESVTVTDLVPFGEPTQVTENQQENVVENVDPEDSPW